MESHTGNFKKYGNSQRGQRIDNQSEITDLLYIMGGYMVKKMSFCFQIKWKLHIY